MIFVLPFYAADEIFNHFNHYLMETGYKYIGYFFLVFIVFVALGFYFPYFSFFPDFKPITTTVHVHALALFLWVFVLIVQPLLIMYKKYSAHRFIGRFTYILMPVIILSSIAVLKKQYDEGIAAKMSSMASLKTLFTSTTELIEIIIFYSFAIINILKGNVAFHMRYIICLSLEFIPPSLGRSLGYWLNLPQYLTYNISMLVCFLILIVLIFRDRANHLNYKPYLIALAILSFFHICWYVVGHPI